MTTCPAFWQSKNALTVNRDISKNYNRLLLPIALLEMNGFTFMVQERLLQNYFEGNYCLQTAVFWAATAICSFFLCTKNSFNSRALKISKWMFCEILLICFPTKINYHPKIFLNPQNKRPSKRENFLNLFPHRNCSTGQFSSTSTHNKLPPCQIPINNDCSRKSLVNHWQRIPRPYLCRVQNKTSPAQEKSRRALMPSHSTLVNWADLGLHSVFHGKVNLLYIMFKTC